MASNVHDIGTLMHGLDGKSRDLIAKIVAHLKSQGNFDELRRDCLEELDKMEAFRQLNQRVESYVATFLSKQEWSDTLSKNQMRDSLRKHVVASEALKTGSQRLVTQVIEKKSRAFQSRLEGVVQDFIYKDKEKEKQERQAWYERRNVSQQESMSKTDQDKYSGISDVNDIISQIKHSDVDVPKVESNIGVIKPDSSTLSQHITHSKTDSTNQLKLEQLTHDKRTDISSPGSDSARQTPPSKTSLAKKAMHPKRISKNSGSPRSSSPSDKPTARSPSTKHSKTTTHENQQTPVTDHQMANAEVKKDGQDGIKPSTNSETGQSSQETSEKKNTIIVQNEVEQKPSANEITTEVATASQKPAASNVHEEKLPDAISEYQETTKEKPSKAKLSDNVDNREQDDQKSNPPLVESDIDDSVSDVSSVHTSDLSSFDGEVSSVSDFSDEDDTDTKQNTKDKGKKNKKSSDLVQEKAKAMATSKGPNKGKKRGRPRKETYQDDKPKKRESKSKRHDTTQCTDTTQGRDKSKRTIKKKRCYSPSSEGSREVCLPSKRTRVGSRD